MARPEKVAVVDEITEKLESSQGVFVTEYRGLTVGQQQTLRRALRAADADYKIMKMTLARRAAEQAGFPDLLEWLQGPTAIAFATGDPGRAAKSLKEFSDQHELLVLKGGLLAGETLSPDDVKRLASLEPREVLLAQLAGVLAGPMSKLAGLMKAVLRQPASAMQQLLEKKEADPSAARAAAEPEPEEAAGGDTLEETVAGTVEESTVEGDEVASVEAADDSDAAGEPVADEPALEAAADYGEPEPAADTSGDLPASETPDEDSE